MKSRSIRRGLLSLRHFSKIAESNYPPFRCRFQLRLLLFGSQLARMRP